MQAIVSARGGGGALRTQRQESRRAARPGDGKNRRHRHAPRRARRGALPQRAGRERDQRLQCRGQRQQRAWARLGPRERREDAERVLGPAPRGGARLLRDVSS